jgi:hypothetical protein
MQDCKKHTGNKLIESKILKRFRNQKDFVKGVPGKEEKSKI